LTDKAPRILGVGSKWKEVASLMLRQLYRKLPRKSADYGSTSDIEF